MFRTIRRLTSLRLFCTASVLALMQGIPAAAQSIDAGPSVLERILGNITTAGTTIGAGNIESIYANIAATSLSVLDRDGLPGGGVIEDVLGNIDARVVVNFISTGAQPLLSEATSPLAAAREWQPMVASLGDVSTTGIGAVLDASATITIGAVQQVSDTIASNAMAVSQSNAPMNALAINAALNSASIDGSVILDVVDLAVDASDISTTVIGAVGGGTIVAGNVHSSVERLNRTVSSFVGSQTAQD